MRRPRTGFGTAALVAAILAAWFATRPAEAREFRAAASDDARLTEGASSSLGGSDGTASGFHVARSDCRRWRAVAANLGETYAGHLLRQTVVRRQCKSLEPDRGDEIWDWPWTSLNEGRVLPPRLHAAHGDWEIRCGDVGGRRRCALLNRSLVPHEGKPGPGDRAIVTHFVIDMIAGREILLWRLFVPAAPTMASAASMASGPTRDAAGTRGEVHYRLGGPEYTETFPACTAAGCLMEARLRHAGDVATRLWEGKTIEVRIAPASGEALVLTLPAAGFRPGFKDLVRLRREEAHPGGKE